MPLRYYDDLIPLHHLDADPHLLSPVVYRRNRSCRDDRYYPYDFKHRRRRNEDGVSEIHTTLEELTSPDLADRSGDLGWTIDYATAFCYKHLNGNRPCIVDTIDLARQAPLNKKGPFLLFDALDRALFQGKLKGMVYLKWRALSDSSPGVTSVPGIRDTRICIELNSRPYEEQDADLDDLLEALIHQMIHAYFLVCCGAQSKDSEQDGRLLDGLHFGVLLSTIKEISEECEDGPLRLIFYAHRRRGRSRSAHEYASHGYEMGDYNDDRHCGRRPYIAMDSHGGALGPPPADGQSHCMHDNRRFRGADIRNWQITHYAPAIELEMDKKGAVVHDLDRKGAIVTVERLRGPHSSTYVELVWDDKRVMVSRAKVLEFESLKKVGKKEGKFELVIPQCELRLLKCIWDFINHRFYAREEVTSLDIAAPHYPAEPKGPPIIVHKHGTTSAPGLLSLLDHIHIFKIGESIKFTELIHYALHRLYSLPSTSEDPIPALKEIYNEDDKDKPIHSELHKWARKFLARTDEPPGALAYNHHYHPAPRGASNYEKLLTIHGPRFTALYHANPALKDDSKLVVAQLSYPALLSDNPTLGVPAPLPSAPYAPRLLRRRSFDPLPLLEDGSGHATPLSLASFAGPLEELGAAGAPYYDYFSRRSGRRRRVNALTGERFTLGRERWRDWELYDLA